MKKFLIASLFLLMPFISISAAQQKSIELSKSNHVVLAGLVDDESITKVILSLEDSKAATTYLFIESPGGQVLAGLKLINYLKTTEKNIECIAEVAISMAHQILQHCKKRIGTPNNLLMQHRISSGAKGNPDEITSQNEISRQMELQLNEESANRIGISLAEFIKKVSSDWWSFGNASKKQNLVDIISLVKCSSELYSQKTKSSVTSPLGQIPVILNGCPLVPPTLDVSRAGTMSPEEVLKIKAFLSQPKTTLK